MKRTAVAAIALTLAMCVAAMAQTPQGPVQAPQTPQQAPPQLPKALLGNLISVPGDWMNAYADQPIERVATVYNVRWMLERLAQQQQSIAALSKAVQELQTKLANPPKPAEVPVDQVKTPVDAQPAAKEGQ